MSTEATGDGQTDAVGADEPEAGEGAETAAAEAPALVPSQATAPHQVTGSADDAPAAESDALSGAGGHPLDDPDEPDEPDERPEGHDEDEYEDEYEDDGRGYDEDYEEYDEDAPGDGAEAPRARRWPRVLLALGFVVLALVIVGGAIAIVGSITHGFQKPVKVTYKKSALFSLKTGECFDPQGQSYSLISCDSPHDAEVFATFTLSGTNWPGTTAVAQAASSGCASRLTGYLNPQLAISLASTYVYPDSVAWQAGTRTVICEVRAESGQLTGSVRGASASAG